MPASTLETPVVPSQVLKGNPLQDPFDRGLVVYLPPGYEQGSVRFPAVYLLAGYAGSGASYLNWHPWDENIQARMDRLIQEGSVSPMILLMPDCFTRYGGSQYINSAGTGRYQDYLLELVAWVDAHYRTIPDRDHRAVAGKSSGGFGAMTLGMDHPDIFGLVADHSGDKFFEKCYAKDLLSLPDLLKRVRPAALLADPWAVRPKDEDFHSLIEIAAMSACYSPDPDSSLGFAWPIDTLTGELLPEVWQRWRSHDPIERVGSATAALRSLRLLFFDCGNQDEYSIHLGCRVMSRRLTDLGVAHRYEEFDGGHSDTRFRYDVSLAAISGALGN